MCGRYTAAKNFSELVKLAGFIMPRVPFFCAALQQRDLAVKTRWQNLIRPLFRWLALATGNSPSRLGRPVVFSLLCGFGLAATVCPAGTNQLRQRRATKSERSMTRMAPASFTWAARLPV
jgi:hypothetical protein